MWCVPSNEIAGEAGPVLGMHGVRSVLRSILRAHYGQFVLPVCVGEATKIVQLLMGDDKAYEATVSFGRGFAERLDAIVGRATAD